MTKLQKLWCLTALLGTGTFFLAGFHDFRVSATNTPQAVPFSQNWTNAALITANDDWSGVPGIVGFLGNYDTVNAPTGVDPRTLLTPFVTNDVDVIANQNSVAITNGGVAEFDGIANPVVALNGSGTADAPSIVVYLNTTGLSNIQFACNIRDIDDTADNAVQQVDVQYRVGGAGNYASVPGGYIADASSGPSTTMTTPLNLSLPAAANNQSQVEVRIITTNASGNDEWIGVDDISVTAGPSAPQQHVLDFNGDGKTDFAVVRNTGGGPTGDITWFYNINGTSSTFASRWGTNGDSFVPVDYDGDNKTDIAIWRTGVQGTFYVLQSQSNTVKIDAFGQTGDDPSIVDDYDGDGKADVAVYRGGANSGDPSFWYYRGTLNNPSGNITYVRWGQNGDFVSPGDYDGDGKADFVIQRNDGGGGARFWMLQTTAGATSVRFGTPTDVIVPGDYDADGKTDIAVARGQAGQWNWYVRPSSTGTINGGPTAVFGASATDFVTQGDYDGDGKTDPAVWRSGSPGVFWALGSTSGAFASVLGTTGDYPVANYNRH